MDAQVCACRAHRSPRQVVLDCRARCLLRRREPLASPRLFCDPDAVARGCAREKEGGKEGKRKEDGGKKKKKKGRPRVAMRRKDKGRRPISVRKEYKYEHMNLIRALLEHHSRLPSLLRLLWPQVTALRCCSFVCRLFSSRPAHVREASRRAS